MLLISTIQPYPHELLRLLKPGGFDDTFWSMWGTGAFRTHEACYEVLETTYAKYFGERKYTDFGSFKAARSYQRAKNRKSIAKE